LPGYDRPDYDRPDFNRPDFDMEPNDRTIPVRCNE